MKELLDRILGLPLTYQVGILNYLLDESALRAIPEMGAEVQAGHMLRQIARSICDEKQTLVDSLRELVAYPEMDPEVRIFLENALCKASRAKTVRQSRAIADQVYQQLTFSPHLNQLINYPEALSFYLKFRQCSTTVRLKVAKIKTLARS